MKLDALIHPMQNEKGLVATRAKTRLVGPRKNGRLMRGAPNFKICRQIVVFPTVPKIGTQCVHVCYLKVIVGYDVFSCAL